jgi:hypothetical protein
MKMDGIILLADDRARIDDGAAALGVNAVGIDCASFYVAAIHDVI